MNHRSLQPSGEHRGSVFQGEQDIRRRLTKMRRSRSIVGVCLAIAVVASACGGDDDDGGGTGGTADGGTGASSGSGGSGGIAGSQPEGSGGPSSGGTAGSETGGTAGSGGSGGQQTGGSSGTPAGGSSGTPTGGSGATAGSGGASGGSSTGGAGGEGTGGDPRSDWPDWVPSCVSMRGQLCSLCAYPECVMCVYGTDEEIAETGVVCGDTEENYREYCRCGVGASCPLCREEWY